MQSASLTTPEPAHVLIVEDNDALRKVAVRMLERLGYRTCSAATANEALDCIARHPPDLLITDVDLPGSVDGIALVERARRAFPHLAVLFASGHGRADLALCEADLLLQKPFGLHGLAECVARALSPA